MAKIKTAKRKATKKRKAAKKNRNGGFKKGAYKCSRCDRTFSMPAHLTRHMNAIHRKGMKKMAATKKMRRGRKGRRPGRPVGTASRLGLQEMSSEELSQLIMAAKQEAQRRLSELQKALK